MPDSPATTTPPAVAAAPEAIAVYARIRGTSEEVKAPEDKPGQVTARQFEFAMDRAFDAGCSQELVYDTVGAPQVERVLKGFNATILAYGQTGSGKTYTMQGPEDRSDKAGRGLVPRACQAIFDGLPAKYAVAVSYVEVYNDNVNDLLGNATNLTLREVRAAGGGVACVPEGLKREPVSNLDGVLAAITRGDKQRVVAAMAMNSRSSRGHGVLAFHVTDADGAPAGRLTLCDLAGMESSKKSGAVESGPSSDAKRKEEAKKINQSLLALSSVVAALATKATRVPYRDSKLTRLLQDSLGGNCKAAIVVTLRGEKENVDEAINTLRFAQRAKDVKVAVIDVKAARAAAQPKNAKMAAELAEAKAALSTYESQLASADHAKASALAEVQNMLDEMQQLQDLQAMIERENKQLQRAAAAKAATKTSGVKRAGSQKQIAAAAEARNTELEEQVKRLEARVSQLEQENLLLRQRDVMGKMLNLGRKTAAEAAPASSSKDTEEKTPTPKPAFLHQFTQKQLVVFEPLADFDTIETTPVSLAREEDTKMERRDSQEIDQKRKLTMMTLFTLRWGRLKKKTKVAPEPA